MTQSVQSSSTPTRTAIIVSGVEAVMGLVINAFFIVVIGMGGYAILLNAWLHNHPHWTLGTRLAVTVGWLIAMTFGIMSWRWLTKAIERGPYPILLNTARPWLRTPMLLRIPVAAWWFGLMIAALLTGHVLSGLVNPYGMKPIAAAIQNMISIAVVFATTVAANGNLLIAIASLTGNETLLKIASRCRLLLDVLITWGLYCTHFSINNPGWI